MPTREPREFDGPDPPVAVAGAVGEDLAGVKAALKSNTDIAITLFRRESC